MRFFRFILNAWDPMVHYISIGVKNLTAKDASGQEFRVATLHQKGLGQSREFQKAPTRLAPALQESCL